KWTDTEGYRDYKYLEKLSKLDTPGFISDPTKPVASFKHAGNAGDLIYALPTIFQLAKGKPIHLFLHEDQPGIYGKNKHPMGNVMLTKRMINMLQPLMWHQPGITSCDPYNYDKVDFNLDLFREFPISLNRGNIARWYFLVFAVTADLSKPWLKAPVNNEFSDAIIIARSLRYNAPGLNYNFMCEHGRCVFIGVDEEYEAMKQMIPQLEYRRVYDFLEMAAIINGSKLFIGNQSFPYSIAEGLKVRRMLEIYHQTPNVSPEGPDAYDFCFQPQFEKLVGELV
ncbi:MAG: hypothetical protein ABIQ56_04015, partial [Chitinophagaceae bacterium]